MMSVADTADALLDQLATYTPPRVEKWIDRAD
jgi:hypothetical protein